jgi:uridine kinase
MDGPMLVAVDGPAGSGTAGVAATLAREVPGPVTVIAAADLYGPETRDWRTWTPEEGSVRYADHVRLERRVLQPLRARRPGRFRRYDWRRCRFGGPVLVRPAGVVIVEGTYLLRPRLRHYWDTAVWVETPRDLRERRLRARGEPEPGWIDRWMAAEDVYVSVDVPRSAAQLILPGA